MLSINTKEAFQNRINAVKHNIDQGAAEEARRIEEEQRAAAELQRQQEAAAAQEQVENGYFRDRRGRWHRPNGQYASKAEIAEAGLSW